MNASVIIILTQIATGSSIEVESPFSSFAGCENSKEYISQSVEDDLRPYGYKVDEVLCDLE